MSHTSTSADATAEIVCTHLFYTAYYGTPDYKILLNFCMDVLNCTTNILSSSDALKIPIFIIPTKKPVIQSAKPKYLWFYLLQSSTKTDASINALKSWIMLVFRSNGVYVLSLYTASMT